jgi:hypothetical protein
MPAVQPESIVSLLERIRVCRLHGLTSLVSALGAILEAQVRPEAGFLKLNFSKLHFENYKYFDK